jgi:hypothetical protein
LLTVDSVAFTFTLVPAALHGAAAKVVPRARQRRRRGGSRVVHCHQDQLVRGGFAEWERVEKTSEGTPRGEGRYWPGRRMVMTNRPHRHRGPHVSGSTTVGAVPCGLRRQGQESPGSSRAGASSLLCNGSAPSMLTPTARWSGGSREDSSSRSHATVARAHGSFAPRSR